MSNETNDADEAAPEGLAVSEDGLALRVRVLNDQGLHARPAAKLAQEAQKFGCDISLALGGEVVDAKSILDILTLAAGQGSELELRATGPEARDALVHLGTLIRNRFR
ncbi:MAG: HPr family phosphocarrier protein [Solidesulfovibrio sp.]|uniref:HPr family phosphocarrier protein n=1 Tax=Solidesulfovibrio sp. TaxID=2910990 RepID=UPI002B21D6CF|nr:HPr family phosphocarrier protein [Solidesulfovibrio sp.]MEA4855717.1 HPr family phosphocarrier protein [Solidesulfovibrio sp.]